MPQSLGSNLLAVVLQESRISEFLTLKKEYFEGDEVVIYDWVAEHTKKYGLLPSLDLTCKRTSLEPRDSEDSVGVWLDQYTDRALYNKIGGLLPELQRELENRKPSAALDKVLKFVEEAQSIRADQQRDVADLPSTLREVLEEYRRAAQMKGMTGVPSGWNYLDSMTLGFQKGDLIIVGARPGIGKSACMAYMANAAHVAGFVPMLVTMEMKRVQMGRRIVMMSSRINNTMLKAGQLSTFAEMKIADEIKRFEQSQPFYVVEGNFRKNFNELNALVYSLRPSIVIVDGAYLLKVPNANPRMARWEQVTLIAEALKDLAFTHNIPVVASFQITRDGGKAMKGGGKIGVEFLQLSDAIGQLASVAVAIVEDEEDENPDFAKQRRMELMKGREGEQGRWFINWNFSDSDFTEIVDESTGPVLDRGDYD